MNATMPVPRDVIKRAEVDLDEAQRVLKEAKRIANAAAASKRRVLAAYLMLRDLRTIRDEDAMVPKIACYVDAHSQLTPDDLDPR